MMRDSFGSANFASGCTVRVFYTGAESYRYAFRRHTRWRPGVKRKRGSSRWRSAED